MNKEQEKFVNAYSAYQFILDYTEGTEGRADHAIKAEYDKLKAVHNSLSHNVKVNCQMPPEPIPYWKSQEMKRSGERQRPLSDLEIACEELILEPENNNKKTDSRQALRIMYQIIIKRYAEELSKEENEKGNSIEMITARLHEKTKIESKKWLDDMPPHRKRTNDKEMISMAHVITNEYARYKHRQSIHSDDVEDIAIKIRGTAHDECISMMLEEKEVTIWCDT